MSTNDRAILLGGGFDEWDQVTQAKKAVQTKAQEVANILADGKLADWQIESLVDRLTPWLIIMRHDPNWDKDYTSGTIKQNMSATEIADLWNRDQAAQKRVTEVERAACTILLRAIGQIGHSSSTSHPGLMRYVVRLTTSSLYYDWRNEIHSNRSSYEKGDDFDYAAMYGTTMKKGKLESHLAYHRFMDDAILSLAGAVAGYRHENRPTGDTTTTIDNMSGISITSSLAAAIAEYVVSSENAIYTRFDDRLDDGPPVQTWLGGILKNPGVLAITFYGANGFGELTARGSGDRRLQKLEFENFAQAEQLARNLVRQDPA